MNIYIKYVFNYDSIECRKLLKPRTGDIKKAEDLMTK